MLLSSKTVERLFNGIYQSMEWTEWKKRGRAREGRPSRADMFFRSLNYRMLVPVLALVIIGLVVLNTVLSTGYGAGMDYPMNFYKQIAAVLIGLMASFVICLFDPPAMRLVGGIIYTVSLFLLVLVKVDGYRALTIADSWLRVPLFGSFQPSELSKIGVAMAAGPVFDGMNSGNLSKPQGFARLALIYGVPFLLIMTEPDFGTSSVLIFMFLCTLFVWGVRWRTIILSSMGMVFVLIPVTWRFILSQTQKDRILTFFFRGHDKTASYHINQSLAAVSSGGLFGNRAGENVSVPVKESDFIFTAISEQFGLIGTTLVILLALYLVIHTLRLAGKIADVSPGEAYVMVTLIASLTFHFVENIGMTIGFMPITGIPLPFMSYGGSSMISNFILLGVLLNISMNHQDLWSNKTGS